MKQWLNSLLAGLKAHWAKLSQTERYIWLAVGVFALGWAVAVQEGMQAQIWEIVATFGTLAAATAALSAASTTRDALRRQVDNEREERRPNLILSEGHLTVTAQPIPDETEKSKPFIYLTFSALNISQHSVNIHEVVFDSYVEFEKQLLPRVAKINRLVAPGETLKGEVNFDTAFQAVDGGTAIFFFHYGATGQSLHALRWKFGRGKRTESLFASGGPGATYHTFPLEAEYADPKTAREARERIENRLFRSILG
jgi:hypothetical protein